MAGSPAPDSGHGRPLRAILLGVNGHPRAVAAVRSLARAGIPVVGIRAHDVPQKCHSRYLRRTLVADPVETELLPLLESLGRGGGGVLFPVYDQYLILVSKHAQTLSKHFTLVIPPWEILNRVMDHACLYEVARGVGLSTPTFFKPRDEADLSRIVAGLDLVNHEYLLKTIPGVGPAELSTGRATKVAGTHPGLVEANCLEIFSRLGEFPLIAEVVPGEANQCFGVTMVVDRAHSPRLTYCTQRLKLQLYSRGGFVHPYELGSNVYCESVYDEEAIDAATRLVKALGYYGLITLEFRRDPRDRRLILIKADPRVVRPTSLSTALGMDTPTALYRLAVDGTVEAPPTYPEGVGWLWETALLETLWNNRDDRPFRRELFSVGRRAGQVRAFAYLSLRDPLPFLMHAQWRSRAFLWTRARNLLRRCTPAGRAHGKPQPLME
jgi:predicted ATP-grasp superfamily ATP-dependent carboligase